MPSHAQVEEEVMVVTIGHLMQEVFKILEEREEEVVVIRHLQEVFEVIEGVEELTVKVAMAIEQAGLEAFVVVAIEEVANKASRLVADMVTEVTAVGFEAEVKVLDKDIRLVSMDETQAALAYHSYLNKQGL